MEYVKVLSLVQRRKRENAHARCLFRPLVDPTTLGTHVRIVRYLYKTGQLIRDVVQ